MGSTTQLKWGALPGLVLVAALSFVFTAGTQAAVASGGATVGRMTESGEISLGLPSSQYLPVMIVLDTSGSMSDPVSDDPNAHETKLQAARSAVVQLVSDLSTKQQVGLTHYPAGGAGCSPGSSVFPLGRPDPAAAQADVKRLHADGNTPTSAALRHAANVLEQSHAPHGLVVLVSDGLANCGPPVCQTAKKLLKQGFSLTVDVVGFDVEDDPQASADLQCAARATGGAYADATDAAELAAALQRAGTSYLTIDTDMPAKLPTVTGDDTVGSTVHVTVTNTGHQDAIDVRTALDFVGPNKVGGAIPMASPIQFLGNLAPGQSRTVRFQPRPTQTDIGTTYQWIATAVTDAGSGAEDHGTVSVASATKLLGTVLDVSGPVAIIGDSYSSGEGAGDYTPGTNVRTITCEPTTSIHGITAAPSSCTALGHVTATMSRTNRNMCHRSYRNYGRDLFGDRAQTIACSGATTANFGTSPSNLKGQTSGAQVMPLQRDALNALVHGPNDPYAVLLTFGGNDAHFADLIFSCAATSDCSASPDPTAPTLRYFQDLESQLPDHFGDLAALYNEVDDIVNNPQAVARRHGEVAPVVVLPYVSIIPPRGQGRDGCFVGVSSHELDLLNEYLEGLNTTIASAVHFAANHIDGTRPIYYASNVEGALLPDHTICAAKSQRWANTVTKLAPNGGGGAALLGMLNEVLTRNPQVGHPNAAGYAAEAQALADWSMNAKPIDAGPTTHENPNLPASFWSSAASAPSVNLDGSVSQAGGDITVQGSGYLPGADVTVQVESVPTLVGTLTADAHGNIHGSLPIPRDEPRGHHRLVLTGLDNHGRLVTSTRRLYLLPRYAGSALLTLGLGLLLVLGWVATRRDRRLGPRKSAGWRRMKDA